jgi:hypothetical protein
MAPQMTGFTRGKNRRNRLKVLFHLSEDSTGRVPSPMTEAGLPAGTAAEINSGHSRLALV